MSELIKRDTVTEIVRKYDTAIKGIKEAYNLLESSEKTLSGLFGECRSDVFPKGTPPYSVMENMDKVIEEIKEVAWYSIFERFGVFNIMTDKAKQEYQRQVENKELPEFTVINILETFKTLESTKKNMVLDRIRESYNEILPGQHLQKKKTNRQGGIGKKVIVEDAFDITKYNSGLELHELITISMWWKDIFHRLDTVFHLMDGKGFPKYPGDLVTGIEEVIRSRKHDYQCETEYFKLKWFKNGNCHIIFKRLDLLSLYNKIGNGENILPAAMKEGRKQGWKE